MSTQEKTRTTRTPRKAAPSPEDKAAAAAQAELDKLALAVAEAADDGSTVSDLGRMQRILSDLRTGLGSAIKVMQNLTDITADLARLRAEARAIVLDSTGRPQWNMRTPVDAYSATVDAAQAKVFENVDKDVQSKILGNVRTMLVRNFLEPVICQYVLTLDGMDVFAPGGSAKLGWTEATKRRPSVVAPFGNDIPEAFRKAVANEYRRCELAVPEKFGGTSTPGGSNKSKGGPDAEVAQAISAAEQGKRAQLATITDVVRLSSALLAERLQQAPPVVNDREKVVALAGRASLLLSAYARTLAGDIPEKDLEAARTLLWTEADSKAK